MHFLKDRGFVHPIASEITPHATYEGRRDWLRQVAVLAAGGTLGAWASRDALAQTVALTATRSTVSGAVTMEKPTSRQDATTYNNYYEFGTDKSDPAKYASTLKPRPWTVAIEAKSRSPAATTWTS